jgi:hypothetical protein
VVNYYDNQTEFSETTNTSIVSDLLVSKYGVDRDRNEYQLLSDGVKIYSSETFCVDIPITYACHHFMGSWADTTHEKITWKAYITNDYYEEKYKLLLQQKDLHYQQTVLQKIPFKYLWNEILKRAKHKLKLK